MIEFYLVSRHGNCGSNVMFHNKDERGYGTNVNNLEVYTLEQAQEKHDWDRGSLPLLKSAVDALCVIHVDMQYLERDQNGLDPNNEYVVQEAGIYDGNDIAFVSEQGQTFDLNKATVHNLPETLTHSGLSPVVWSKQYLETLARKTFQAGNIDQKAMITDAGIKLNKPKRQRPTTGKTRMNCPCCGRINWQYDPYTFQDCSNVMCDEF